MPLEIRKFAKNTKKMENISSPNSIFLKFYVQTSSKITRKVLLDLMRKVVFDTIFLLGIPTPQYRIEPIRKSLILVSKDQKTKPSHRGKTGMCSKRQLRGKGEGAVIVRMESVCASHSKGDWYGIYKKEGSSGWRDSSVVDISAGWSSSGPEFVSQNPHGSSQPSIIPVPGPPTPSSGIQCCRHTHRQTTIHMK